MNKQDILIKIRDLTIKWKDNVPPKSSNEWWRYRADQLRLQSLNKELKKFGKNG